MIKSRARAAIKPMKHQTVSLAHDKTTPIVFYMSDPGTGKTAVRIWAWAERRRKGGGCLLVLAPRSLLRAAWANDFAKFAPDMKVSVATADNRAAAFAEDADVYITNHDAVKWLTALKPAQLTKFSELVIDEAEAFKHHTSQRARAALKLSRLKHIKRKSVLTATPTSNGICDIWHLVLLLDGGERLGPLFFNFRSTVCTPEQVGANAHAIKWHDKPGAEEAVFGLISDIVMRHQFEDCVDIPATHQYTVDYELTPKQRKLYETMELTQLLPLLQGKNLSLTAVNAAAVATKLLQICSGAVYTEGGKYQLIDSARYEAIIDMAAERKHPLVFFFWQHQRQALIAEAEKRGMTYAVIDGESSDTERITIVNAYQRGVYAVLFAHPKSAAHGLTLTAGNSIIWTGPTYDLSWFKQGNRRQARIGQKSKTEIIVCLAKDSIEERVYHDILMAKDKRMGNLLDLFGGWK
jgi:SNF2 family DNA or RNA helicase